MSKFKNLLLSFLLSTSLFCGIQWLALSLFTVEISLLIPTVVGTVIIASCCVSLLLDKNEWVIPTIWLALLALFAAIFWNKTANGLAFLLNEVIDTYKQVYPKNYDIYAVSDSNDVLYAVAELAALLAVGCSEAIKRRSVVFCWATALLIVVSGALFLPVISVSWYIVAALTLLMMLFIGTAYRKQKIDLAVRWTVLRTWLRTATIFLLIIVLLYTIAGPNTRPDTVDSFAENVADLIDGLRYGSIEHTGLIEGDLSKAGTRSTETATMLKVTMSKPASYYLRGFIGEVYKDNRWSELSREMLYENSDIFDSLHQSGFYAQSQIAAAADMLGEGMTETQNIIQVENVGLPSKYLYAPYELLPWSPVLEQSAIGDSTIYADGFKGEREYTLSVACNLVVRYQKIAALLYQKQDTGGVADYLKSEAAYNQFVYEQYTALPSDIDTYLAKKLGNYVIEDGQIHFDYQKAKQNVLYYLTENVTYNENVDVIEDGVDFVLNFLDGTKTGYDVHYATAAVMMFRYYGIPARYAEGYIITKDEAANAEPGEQLTLDSTHAHAWAEYYQDGVGWLPFEVTPTYLSVMEQADTYRDISGLIGQAPENEVIDALQPDTVTEDETPLLLSFWLKNKLTILLVCVLLCLSLLILLFVFWLVRERRKTAKRKASFISRDLRRAICDLFEYIIDLATANGLKPDNRPADGYADFFDVEFREAYHTVVSIWQEAKFSDHDMTEEQRIQVVALKDGLWMQTWENAGLLRKLQLKFLYFL